MGVCFATTGTTSASWPRHCARVGLYAPGECVSWGPQNGECAAEDPLSSITGRHATGVLVLRQQQLSGRLQLAHLCLQQQHRHQQHLHISLLPQLQRGLVLVLWHACGVPGQRQQQQPRLMQHQQQQRQRAQCRAAQQPRVQGKPHSVGSLLHGVPIIVCYRG